MNRSLKNEYLSIGIVIPVLNMKSTVSEAIDSLLSQNYPKLEVIVIDGCSTDGTIEVLDKYGERISWISEKDEGQVDAINKGISLLRTDVCKWLNADDRLLPGSLDRINNYFIENPRVSLVYGDIEFISSNGISLGVHEEPSYSKFVLLYGHNLFADPACFWKRSLFNEVGPLSSRYKYSMDYELWVKLARKGKLFGQVALSLAEYRIAERGLSIRYRNKMRLEHFQILIENTPWLQNIPEPIGLKILQGLLIVARLFKKYLVFIERRRLVTFSFTGASKFP